MKPSKYQGVLTNIREVGASSEKRAYLSASALKAFAKSPNHYLEYVSRKFEATPAMMLGTLVHCLILEPNEFSNRYAVAPKVDKRTKLGKDTWAQFQADNDHLEVLTEDQYDEALNVVNAAYENLPELQTIWHEMTCEQTYDAPLFGYDFRAIIDAEGLDMVWDIKTTQDASPEGFQRQAYNLDYHLQAAVYRLMTGKRFGWIAIETKAPYNVTKFVQSEDAFQRSAARLGKLVQAFIEWDGNPQGYTSQEITLDLPRWA